MIDMHVHVVEPNLPGCSSLGDVLALPLPQRAEAIRAQMREADVEAILGMGRLEGDDDPLGIAETLELAEAVEGLYAIGAMDPRRSEPEHLRRVERELKAGRVKALKGYLGYLHFAPDHPGYRAYYELAERHRVPVIFHTGDTWSSRGKLKYAHPLGVDEVAVDHPRVSFVMAHVGNPWMIDAAEVVYKNVNAYVDVSGLTVGDAAAFADPQRREALDELLSNLRKAFRYAERPNRFLYGSDWPLAPMAVYRAWVAPAIPEIHHAQVFEENARALFRL